MLDQLRGVGPGRPRAVAQQFGVLGHDHGQLVAGIGLLEALGQVPGVEVAVDLGHLVGVGVFPAQLDGGDAAIRIRAEGDGIQGGGAVPGADLTGIDGIIAEVLVGDIPVLVSDQAVVGDHIGVEIDLDLGIQGDDLQGGGQIFDEEFLGFIQIIDIGVVAVAVVGQLLPSSHHSSCLHNRLTGIHLKSRLMLSIDPI